MKLPFFKWYRNVSIAKKLYFTVGIMALLIAVELFVLIFSIHTLSSVRAYVNGEGLWSKAQKDGIYQLLKYARTQDEADYIKFRDFLKVNLGDHKTRMELSKPHPDMAIARQGFIEGKNHPDDSARMTVIGYAQSSANCAKKWIARNGLSFHTWLTAPE